MPPAAGRGRRRDEWYVSFDGEQEGPLPLARALDRVRAERPRGKECYCWRGGFFVWLPIEDVPEFAPALVKLPPPIPAVRPRPATGHAAGDQVADGKAAGVQVADAARSRRSSRRRGRSRRCARRRAPQPAVEVADGAGSPGAPRS